MGVLRTVVGVTTVVTGVTIIAALYAWVLGPCWLVVAHGRWDKLGTPTGAGADHD